MAKNREMTLFRDLDGKRVPFKFIVDPYMTILSEEVDRELLEKLNPTTHSRVSISSEDGQTIITKVSEQEGDIIRFFTPTSDNPFPGVEFEVLRKEFFKDRQAIIDGECPGCQGNVIRKYRAKLEALLE